MKFEMHNEVAVAAPPEAAWRVLGEQFGRIAEWSHGLASSRLVGPLGVGAKRVCESVGWGPFPAGAVTEELVHFDPEGRAFTYVATEGLPSFVRSARNAWTIRPDGDGCVVAFTASLDLVWWAAPFAWLLPRTMRADIERMNEELRYRVEHGVPHPRGASGGVRAEAS